MDSIYWMQHPITQFNISLFIMSWVSSLMFRERWNFRLWLTSSTGHGSVNEVEMIWVSRIPLDHFKNGCLLDAKWRRALFLASQALKFNSLRLKGICFLSRSMIVRVHDVCLFYEQHLEVNVMLVVRCCLCFVTKLYVESKYAKSNNNNDND